MKARVALVPILIPSLVAGLSVRDGCLEHWPEEIAKGKVELSYSIDESCRAVDLNFEVSSPEGAFDQYAECHINRSVIMWDPNQQSDPIPISEYESHLAEFREENPRRYNQRSILAKESDGTQVGIFCYFTENWEGTEFGVMRNTDEEIQIDSDYFDTLPKQRFKATFTTGL